MSRPSTLLLVFTVASFAQLAHAEAPPGYHEVRIEPHTFTLREGFTIERAAGSPLVDRPVTIDLDEAGRLYATEVSGSIEKEDVQQRKTTHRVVRLEDTDGDGRYDKQLVFADQMQFPEGSLWHAGSLYVAAPPQIWKLTDTDGDGVADKREVWFDGQTLTGCANDLHGPYLGPDGWIYWAKGAFARQTYTLPSGKEWSTRASHVFRARPDGTGIEPVMTGGMDNPVDVAFTPGGERILSNTFIQRPAAGLRDGLLHIVYGGIYGKDNDPLYEPQHKWTSPELMPPLTHMGPAAPCGLHCLQSDQFGPEFQDNLFACQFNLRKVSRHVLKPSGATFTTEDHDFLVSDNTDFHPTDVIEDTDGSLLVVDTGGWYKLCCPSSQLVKEDVLGAIYRVRKVGAHKIENPRGWQYRPVHLVRHFDDPRPAVRRRVIEDLGRGGSSAIKEISAGARLKSPLAVTTALWAACRIDRWEGRRVIVRQSLAHPDETVRQVAIHVASLHRDKDAVTPLIALLKSESLHNRRAAAEALGRVGDASVVPALVEALADPTNDRVLDHSLTYALIEIGDEAPLRSALNNDNARVRRAVIVALDQIGAKLDPQVVLAALSDRDQPLRDSARWIASRHPEWDSELVVYLRERLASPPAESAEQAALVELLAKLTTSQAVQKLLADAAVDTGAPRSAAVALRAMAASSLREMPAGWLRGLQHVLRAGSPVVAEGLAVVRTIPPVKSDAAKFAQALVELAESSEPPEIRLAALAAVPGGLTTVSESQLELLLTHISRDRSPSLRGLAADCLSRARLSSPQLLALAERLPESGPLELDRLLAAFAHSGDEAVGLKLVEVLHQPALRAGLTVDSVRQRLQKQAPAVHAEAGKLYAAIDAEHAQQASKLEEMLRTLPTGDIRRGQAVFNSAKVACRSCHTIGYVGGNSGPDLTRIGRVRTDRDLLESILYPSSSFVQTYEPLLVRTLDGQIHSGVVTRDAPDELVLTVAADKEVRIPKDEVEIAQPGKVSIMPSGLDKQLTLQEIADLVAFLRNCK